MQTACKSIASLLALMLVLCSYPARSQQNDLLQVREVPVGKVDRAAVENSRVISPDARHLAYVVKHQNGMAVVLDGREGQLYDEVPAYALNMYGQQRNIKFSDDGAHFAYAARNGQKSFLVVDGVKGSREYDRIDPGNFFFSPNRKRMAFVARQSGKWIVVVDGVESKPYDYLGTWPLHFTPDSRHISFTASLRDKYDVLVLDGKEIDTAQFLLYPMVFSPDGKHWAYRTSYETATAVIDGKRGKACERVGPIIFSPDSLHSLYSAKNANGACMVLDGVEQKHCPAIGTGDDDYDFDANDQPVYTVLLARHKEILVTGKQESKPYDLILTAPSCSTHGEHITFLAVRDKKRMIVHDGQEGEAFDEIDGSAVSSDGQRLLYSGVRENKRYLVTNGNRMLLPDGITPSCMALGPDADHYAYCFPRDGKWHVVVDGKETASYDSDPADWPFIQMEHPRPKCSFTSKVLTRLEFTPAGHLIYIATNSGKQFVVFDGAKGADYDKIGDIYSWDTERSLTYAAWRGNKVVIVYGGKESPAYDEILTYAPGTHESPPRFICQRGDQYLLVMLS